MKYIYPAIIFLLAVVQANAAPMALTYSPECILKAVARAKKVKLSRETPAPNLYLESKSSLKDFQDLAERQWGIRPDSFMNVYVVETNSIYLIDDEASYKKNHRFVDDSLAHELTHYIQVKYQGAVAGVEDDSLEADAVAIQTWFRENYMLKGVSPCDEAL